MKVKLEPLLDRVVVRPNPAKTETSGGLLIPEQLQEQPQRGTVLAVGEGKEDEPMKVKPQDLVLYSKNAGAKVTVDGEDVLILRQCDIFSILEPIKED